MTVYVKERYDEIISNMTQAQKTIFNNVILRWNDSIIEINDTEFIKLPANIQTKISNLITRMGYT